MVSSVVVGSVVGSVVDSLVVSTVVSVSAVVVPAGVVGVSSVFGGSVGTEDVSDSSVVDGGSVGTDDEKEEFCDDGSVGQGGRVRVGRGGFLLGGLGLFTVFVTVGL